MILQRTAIASTVGTLVLAAGVHAQVPASIPSTAPFYTDTPNEYVADQTAQGVGSLNMVLCIIGGMDMGDNVNVGPYIALVDVNHCNSQKGGGGSGAAGATNFATAVVEVTRADNSSPMVGKVWMSFTEQGVSRSVYAYLNATASPSASPPYGTFRMDYIGKDASAVMQFNGFIDAQPGLIKFFETGTNSSNTALAITTNSTTSGSGSMNLSGSAFDFAYDSTNFRRRDASADECFDRSRLNAHRSVWRYGTYSAADGSRVDLAHPGFPIKATYQSQNYFGFANFWGINFEGLDLNAIADANPIPSLTVSDQRTGNTNTYSLSKLGGKLTKWTQVPTTLNALDGIPFVFGADLTGQTSNAGAVAGWANWVAVWSSANGTLSITGQQVCGQNGCVATALAGNVTATVNPAFFAAAPIAGWSDSFGGNLVIPSVNLAAHVPNDAVYYYTQSTVLPGDPAAPATLYCLSQCPTMASIAAFHAGSATDPWGNNTGQQWFDAQSTNTVTYTFGAGGLAESGTAIVLGHNGDIPQGSSYLQGGVMTGRLFDTQLVGEPCPAGAPQGASCVHVPANPQTYYTWSTGPNQWNQSLWLTNASTSVVVAFDAPQNIPYTVPPGSAYGSYAGKSILLQFNGFGNLFGIPGYCVDAGNNSAVDCSSPNSRYVPLFSIPDNDLSMTLAGSPSKPLIVKALDAEVRLADLGASLPSSPCAAMTLTPQTIPTGGTHDPSNSQDSEYLGPQPAVSGNPKVVDGALQH